jgi:hypothetical protein
MFSSFVKWIGFIIPSVVVTWQAFLTIVDSEVGFKDFFVQAIGGGVGAYRAFILLLEVILFITLVYIGKKVAFGEPKKVQIRFFYVISILGFLSFSILGGEFNAPKFTFAPFMDFKKDYSTERVVRRSDVEFRLQECSRWGNKISCSINVYNFGEDVKISDGSRSYLVDDNNNSGEVNEFQMGSQPYKTLYFGSIPIPEGADAELTVSFENNSYDSSKLVRALYINVSLNNKRQKIIFRNIGLKLM